MRLLVVGGSGFLGRNILSTAAALDWELAATYWKDDGFPRFASQLGCSAVRHDLLGPPRNWEADACIYLAGNADHRRSVASPVDDLRLNAEGLIRFLAGYSGALVLMSTAAVYEGQSGGVSPETRTDPQMPYAISKLAAERYVKYHAAQGRLESATILRLYYAFGPHDRPSRLIPRLVRAAREGQKTFVVTAPRGTLLDPLFSEDVARAALAAAKGRGKGRTFDLCAGAPQTVPELIRAALNELGTEMALVEQPRTDETPVIFHSDPSPAMGELGLGPFVPFREGLRRYSDWLTASVG